MSDLTNVPSLLRTLVGPHRDRLCVKSKPSSKTQFGNRCLQPTVLLIKTGNQNPVGFCRSEAAEARIPPVQPWYEEWERLQGDPHPPPPHASRPTFHFIPFLHNRAQRSKIPVSCLDLRPEVQRGREAAAPGTPGAGPGGAPPVPPPRLPATQSARVSGARCAQSGAAGAAPGARGRGASLESREQAAALRPRGRAAEQQGRTRIPAPAQPALPRRRSGRRSGPCSRCRR